MCQVLWVTRSGFRCRGRASSWLNLKHPHRQGGGEGRHPLFSFYFFLLGSSELVLEKTLESPLDCKEIQPVHPKGDQSWVFTGRTDAEAETPILWPPDAKNWLIGKDPDAGKDGRQEEKRTTEDEMVGWHHRLNGHEFEQAPGVGDGQGGLACCGSWRHRGSDMTEGLNWTESPSIHFMGDSFQVAEVFLCQIILLRFGIVDPFPLGSEDHLCQQTPQFLPLPVVPEAWGIWRFCFLLLSL